MRPSFAINLLRDTQTLAVGISLVAHAAVAAAGYTYVSWPRTVAVTVIPVEIIAAPAGPGNGSEPGNSADRNSQQPVRDEAQPRQPVDRATEQPEVETALLEPAETPPESTAATVPPESVSEEPANEIPEPPVPAPQIDDANMSGELNEPAASTPPDVISESNATNPSLVFVETPKKSETPEIATENPIEDPDSEMPVVASVPVSTWSIPAPTKSKPIMPVWSLPTAESGKALRDQDAGARRPETVHAVLDTAPPENVVSPRSARMVPPLPRTRPTHIVTARVKAEPAPNTQSRRGQRVPNAAVPLPQVRPQKPPPVDHPITIPLAAPAPPAVAAERFQTAAASAAAPARSDFPDGRETAAPRNTDDGPPTAHLGAADTQPAKSGGSGGGLGTDLRPMPGNPAPRYPRIARERGWQGRVVLEVAVTDEGVVERAEVDQTSGYRPLDIAALTAVRRWRFAFPAQTAARTTVVRVPILFKLSDE